MKREYGLDLLKMTAMAMVVAYHILQSGGVEGKLSGADVPHLECAFRCFCYCAVDCFVMATGYIMCRHTFKYIRIFRLWRQVVGYSLAIATVAWVVLPAGSVGWRDWAGAVMPIVFNRYWFFTEYAALFFCIPFLNRMLGALTGREQCVLVASGFGILSVMPFVAGLDLFFVKWGYSLIWFLYLYLLGAILALGNFREKIATGWIWLLLAVGLCGSFGGEVVSPFLSARLGGGARLSELAWSYASPTMVLEAVALLLLFARIDVRSERLGKVIGLIAPSTFVVYVVHSNDNFRQIVRWKSCFLGLADMGEVGAVIGTAIFAVAIFIVVVCVDLARRVIVSQMPRGGFGGHEKRMRESHHR